MAARPTLILDLDGTLIDTAPDLAGALDALLLEETLEPLGLDAVRRLVGNGIPALVAAGLEARGATFGPEQLAARIARFMALYEPRMSRESACYPGAATCLAALRDAGWRLGVCTNKVERLSRRLLDEFGLGRYFAAVSGPDTHGVRKPDPDHLLKTIEAVGGCRDRAVMVGDSAIDVATAKAANVPVIALGHGYARTPLAAMGADVVLPGFRDLPAALDALMRGRAGRPM